MSITSPGLKAREFTFGGLFRCGILNLSDYRKDDKTATDVFQYLRKRLWLFRLFRI
ncbi:MAG: hypothetical protein GX338_08790 [Firmicutes bacterium]|nr:hypothetical protein [Bacillota bacterium]